MDGRRVRARPGEGARLREEILRTAEALLVEAGTEDALTLRAVARAAGVTTPSVYLHFAGKEALVAAVCLRVWDELDRRMERARAGEADPLRALGACGHAYVRFALDHPVQYRVLLMRPAEPEGAAIASTACFGHMTDTVTACVEAGFLRGDPRTLALGLWTAVHGCVSLLITQPSLPWPDDLDGFIEDTVRMAGYGGAVASRLPRGAPPPPSPASSPTWTASPTACTGPAPGDRLGKRSQGYDPREIGRDARTCDHPGMNTSLKAFLEGGPDDLPERIVGIRPPGVELKLPFRGGYEHFKVTSRHRDTAEGRLPVYRHTGRTAVAE
ncbi:TetR family transcriptional regulator [Actinomadura sp. J1-007]|uniref:DUF5988 family protein n=1 Tax=Actinomadura sp. J1-007 TaxID=2661913 RepID=UPI001321F465|nr:DUF5988 family protein [Actinomadura sp. J1-007]MWK38972.1 TetR family transcriptional regulator [Actinomadura sp. J1-007]